MGGRPDDQRSVGDYAEFLPDCSGATPAKDYPATVPISNIILNWNPDNASVYSLPGRKIFRTVCRFDYQVVLVYRGGRSRG